jgi:hypothetical protein
MRARQEDLRAALLAAHVVDIGAHPVAGAEALARDQLVAAHDASPRPRSTMTLPNSTRLTSAVDDLADAVLVLVELPVALGLAHLLHDDLLGGLGGDAAEIDRRQGVAMKSPELGVGIDALACLDERDLDGLVLDLLDHLASALSFISPVCGLISARMSVSWP